MNIGELMTELNALNIPKDAYSVTEEFPIERCCIAKNNGKWEVYYSEHGTKSDLRVFDSEELACDYFLNWISRYFSNRMTDG